MSGNQVAIVALGGLMALGACRRASTDDHGASSAAQPDFARTTAPASHAAQPIAVFAPGTAEESRVTLELARTPHQIQRGLMYRRHMPPDAGMLFLFRKSKVQSFWMKNTLIPLDMIFVSEDMVVVGIVERAEPQTLTSRTVGKPSRYVIEVNGGWTQAHGVVAGTEVRFEGVDPPGPGSGSRSDD